MYQVEYISNAEICSYKNQLKSILFILNELERYTQDSLIIQFALNILDQIRFLFKSKDYEHEKELRIIKWSNAPISDDGKREREIPHLYVEMEKSLELDEVILGPKVEKPAEIAPYLYYTNKVKKVSKSSIKYQ